MIRNTLFDARGRGARRRVRERAGRARSAAHIDFQPVYAGHELHVPPRRATAPSTGRARLRRCSRISARARVGDIAHDRAHREDQRAEEHEHHDREEVEDRHGPADHRGRPDHRATASRSSSNSLTGDRAFDGKGDRARATAHRQHHRHASPSVCRTATCSCAARSDRHQPGRGIRPPAGHHPPGRHRGPTTPSRRRRSPTRRSPTAARARSPTRTSRAGCRASSTRRGPVLSR